jgi:hypothetical protein
MRNAAVDWTAVGSVATGGATIAAFLTILATIAVYYFQSRRDRADTIRQVLQFIHGQQVQVLWLLDLGLMAIIDKQIRDFKDRIGPNAKSDYFIRELFDNQALFRTSAADSNLSSDAYSKMSSVWDQINAKAFELRGALRIFSYACRALIEEPYRLSDPDFTVSVLGAIGDRDQRARMERIDSLDELVNKIVSELAPLAISRFEGTYRRSVEQGSVFVGMLADMTLSLSTRRLLKLSRKRPLQPSLDTLKTNLLEAVSASLDHMKPELPEKDLQALHVVLNGWREDRPPDHIQSGEASAS